MSFDASQWVVSIPTYNEYKNSQTLFNMIFDSYPGISIIVVDGGSKDGTVEVLQQIEQERKPHFHVIHQKSPIGRGAADWEGFKYAQAHGFKYVVQMDADLSHAPHYISQFASCMLENDMVIGSRLISGGKILERKKRRNLLTWAANIFIRRMLNIPVYDCTSGYRCFNIELLNKIGQQNTMTNGPANLTEVLYYAHQLGAKIKEVPIIFADRQHGQSKLTGKELMESVRIVFRLRGQYAKL